MKNATFLLSVFTGAMLASCAGVSPTRVIGDTAGAAGGALVGHALSKGNPLITAAGAGAGVLLSDIGINLAMSVLKAFTPDFLPIFQLA